jgi:hypothetical protein
MLVLARPRDAQGYGAVERIALHSPIIFLRPHFIRKPCLVCIAMHIYMIYLVDVMAKEIKVHILIYPRVQSDGRIEHSGFGHVLETGTTGPCPIEQ